MTAMAECERDVLHCIVTGLTLMGYTVLRVGQRRSDLGGQDRGAPDLLVTCERFPPGVWIGLEAKGSRTRLSAEQQRLLAARRIHIVRSWEDALAAIRDFEGKRS
jgi:hypothetical protein